MMGLLGWRGSVMRMPTPAEAIASSRTRRTSRTAFNDRRDGGLGEALLTDHLHPIQIARQFIHATPNLGGIALFGGLLERSADRKSTRLNSSHLVISYAVFCLKKKK